jgi:hypothetical protein
MVPLDLERGETYEDPSLVDPEQRRRSSGVLITSGSTARISRPGWSAQGLPWSGSTRQANLELRRAADTEFPTPR